jgi:hypothetical protein
METAVLADGRFCLGQLAFVKVWYNLTIKMMEFEWNSDKAKANLRKHGVSFEEAATVFDDPLYVDFYDPIIQSAKSGTLS